MEKVPERQLGIASRRKAREAALQALYQCDTLGDCSEQQLDFFFIHFFPESVDPAAGPLHDNYQFARRLLTGVLKEIAMIDSQISGASSHWSVSRMARVDRNIIRIAVFEIACIEEIPVNVSINEAIEVAKRFGAPDSPVFVNGVLDHVAKNLIRGDEGPIKKKAAAGG